ncbi:MAG: thioesterase family protein [Microcoleaceae cyanobacterium]
MSPIQPSQFPSTAPLTSDDWLNYPVHVFPHQTDYAGVVWHGSYINWLEEARVEWLRRAGLHYRDLVAVGCDLPVVDLSIRYHQSVTLGMDIMIRCRLVSPSKVRIQWEYQIESVDAAQQYATATVTLVAVDSKTGKIMRRLPPQLQALLSENH